MIMNKQSGIYSITNMLSGKQYIGQSKDLRYRFKRHLDVVNKNKKQHCFHIHNAMKKYGVENFRFDVIVYVEGKEMLDLLETRIIEAYNTLAPGGYNLDTGGTNNRKYSSYKRKKMSNRVPWNKGKKMLITLTDEERQRRSDRMKEHNKVNPLRTEEQKQNQSQKMKGKVAWNKGVPMTEEQKELRKMKDKSYKNTAEFKTKHKAGVAKYWEQRRAEQAIALG